MYRISVAFALWLLTCTVGAQSFGVLLGIGRTDLRAAGVNFQPASGMSAGIFVPFYVNDRLVVRAEAAMSVYGSLSTESESDAQASLVDAGITALGRYYLDRKVSLSAGIQGIWLVSPPTALVMERTECPERRMDASLLLGAAYRFTDRFEVGVRYGQGLLPAVEFPNYGTAHRRRAHVMLSYLLHATPSHFAERRKWRSGLAMAHRY